MMKLKPESLATPAVFTVAVPAGAELKKELKIGATIAMRQDLGPVRDATPKPVPVNEVFPVTVTTVPALEVTALAADDQAKPAHVVPHVICRVEATDLKVAIEPPEGVELAANEIALGAAKVGSIRNPQFPLVRYAPDREYTFKITASAAGRTTTAELKLKLAGDGKPGADEFLAWEKSLRKRDFTDFAQGMGNLQDSGTGAKFALEREEFIGNTSRREFIHFAKPAEIADFTFEFDTYMEGHGNRANGAPVAMVSREQRTKLLYLHRLPRDSSEHLQQGRLHHE